MRTLVRNWLVVLAAFLMFCATGRADDGKGLVADFPFDEGKGSIAHDVSGNKNHGTLHRAEWVKTYDGYALKFGARGSYVDCGKNPDLRISGDLTIMIWAKLTPDKFPDPDANWTIVDCEEFNKSGFILRVDGSTARLLLRSSHTGAAQGKYSRARLKKGVTYHVAVVRQGRKVTYYVDGVSDSTMKAHPPEPPTKAFRISNATQSFNGMLDDLKIYNRALSDDEIAAAYNAGAESRGKKKVAVASGKSGRAAQSGVFTVAENQIAFEAGKDSLHLANQHVGVEFLKAEGIYRLSRLYGIEHDQDFLPSRFLDDKVNLWQVMLRRDKGRTGDDHFVNLPDARSCSHRVDEERWGTTLSVEWTDIDLPDMKAAMDVRVSVTLKRDDPLCYWRIRVRNRGRTWGLWQVRFPMLRLVPIGDDRRDNCFVYCKDRGRVIENCFDTPKGYGHGFHADEPPPIGFGQSMPGSLSMQFQALYNKKTGRGLYLTTYDGEPYMKHLRLINSSRDIQYQIGHDPADMGYPDEDYSMPYDFAVGPFTGDWYDAARIYRRWALKQKWCSKGPLRVRTDIPKWFKEAPLFLVSHARSDDKFLAGNVKAWLELLKIAKAPVGGTWYGWKKYVTELTAYDVDWSPWRVTEERKHPCSNVHDGCYPKMPALPGLSEGFRKIREAGGHPAPYVCLQIYDQGRLKPSPYAEEARPNVMRNVHGKLKIYGDEGGSPEPSWAMCVTTDWWRKRLAETCAELVRREHAGGIYLDTMHGSSRPCFAVEHGHSHGGGSYRIKGMHELARICRDAVKAADPNAYTDGENPTENMIDVVDGILYQYTLRPGISAPILAAVYQDYIPRYGMKCNLGEGEGFFIQAGSLFVEGAQMGRFYTHGAPGEVLLPSDPKYAEQIAYLKRLVGYYQQEIAKKFLCYGQLLRPLRFAKPDPMPLTNYVEERSKSYLGGLISLPVLQSGVFRASDGEIGLFIVNMSAEELSFSATITLSDYGIARNTPCDVESITWDGKHQMEQRAINETATLSRALPDRSVIMYRIAARE